MTSRGFFVFEKRLLEGVCLKGRPDVCSMRPEDAFFPGHPWFPKNLEHQTNSWPQFITVENRPAAVGGYNITTLAPGRSPASVSQLETDMQRRSFVGASNSRSNCAARSCNFNSFHHPSFKTLDGLSWDYSDCRPTIPRSSSGVRYEIQTSSDHHRSAQALLACHPRGKRGLEVIS